MPDTPAAEGQVPLAAARDLRQHFLLTKSAVERALRGTKKVYAVDGVSLELRKGETVGLIGESGSGKSTFGRTLLRLHEPTSGRIEFQGKDITEVSGRELFELRRRMQMIFQNPYSAVNRRRTLLDVITEPLQIHRMGDGASRRERATELLDMVGLDARFGDRYPHEVSGGQLQRVVIARALSLEPDLVVADEPTAALDVSIRAQVINLLADLQRDLGLTMLFISHDLSTVSYLATRVAVMYLGKVVELAATRKLEHEPLHPYTRALIASIPRPDPTQRRETAPPLGEIPSPVNPPAGCHYHPRCPLAMPVCSREYPALEEKLPDRMVACHAVISDGVGGVTTHPEAGSATRVELRTTAP